MSSSSLPPFPGWGRLWVPHDVRAAPVHVEPARSSLGNRSVAVCQRWEGFGASLVSLWMFPAAEPRLSCDLASCVCSS